MAGAPPDQKALAEFYSASEVARILGVKETTLGRWHAARRGPPRIKVGNLILYRKAAFAVWLQEVEVGPVDRATKQKRRAK